MQALKASPHILTVDAVLTGVTLPTPDGSFKLPANYFLVIDSITCSLVSAGAESVGVEVFNDENISVYKLARDIGANTRDVLHVSFPRGLIISKQTTTPGTGQTFSYRGMGTYTPSSLLFVIGSPSTAVVTLTYRYVAPSDY